MNGDVWRPTMHLRWWKPSMLGILQQKWTSNKGETEWRDIEVNRDPPKDEVKRE